MSDPLTPIERKVYHYLLDFLAENTYQPSVREIGRRLRIKSTKTVTDPAVARRKSLWNGSMGDRAGADRRYSSWRRPSCLYARVNPVAPYAASENRGAMSRSTARSCRRTIFPHSRAGTT
jgi:hypothetical protein